MNLYTNYFSHNFKNSIILIDIIGHICRTDCEIRDVYIVCTDKIMLISISEALNIYHFFLWENVKLHFSISLQNKKQFAVNHIHSTVLLDTRM